MDESSSTATTKKCVVFFENIKSEDARSWMTQLVMFSHQSTIWMIWRSCSFAFFGFPGRAAPRNVNVYSENWARNLKKQPFNEWKVYCVFIVQLTHCRQKTCFQQEEIGQACQRVCLKFWLAERINQPIEHMFRLMEKNCWAPTIRLRNVTRLAADCISMIQVDVPVKHATVAATFQRHVKSLTLK